jgi:hypothetical protein
MLTHDALWLVDELAFDQPADPLPTPEIRLYVVHDLHDDDFRLLRAA